MIEHPRPRFAPWLVEPMLRNKGTYLKVALAAAMINIFGLITSLFTMTVYDRVVPNNAFSSLVALSIGLAIVVSRVGGKTLPFGSNLFGKQG